MAGKGRLLKLLMFAGKLAVTVGVMWWVLSGVSWYDYAVTLAGQHVRVLDEQPGSLHIESKDRQEWLPAGQFVHVEDRLVRPGVGSAVATVQVSLFLLGALLLAGQLVIMGVRWWWLLRFNGLSMGLCRVLRLTFVGHFFNFFLPGSTGGDLLRAYLAAKGTRRRTVVVTTVLVDRFTGLASMAILAGIMTIMTGGSRQTRQATLAVGLMIILILVVAALMFSPTVGRLLNFEGLIERLPRKENFRLALETLHALSGSPDTALVLVGLTTLALSMFVAGIACLGGSLHLAVPVYLYVLFIPIIYILAAIPMSIGGVGVTEGMYILLFAPSSGVSDSPLLALALLARITPMALSLPGLVFWYLERNWSLGVPVEPLDGAPSQKIRGAGMGDAMGWRKQSISVFFPFFNEEANVRRVVGDALAFLPKVSDDFEVILVNDGSSDHTGEIIDELAVLDERIRPVHHEKNRGYGGALQSGFRAATKELVFYTDGDGQFDIAEMTRLIEWIDQFDIVSGYRAKRQDNFIRRLNAWCWGRLVERMLGFRCRDVDSAFKLYRREIFDRIDMKSTGALIDAEILARAVRAGFRLTEVPVSHRPRFAGRQTGAKISVIARAFVELFRLRRAIVAGER